MHRILAVLCVCLTSGCAAVPENLWALNKQVSGRFTYMTDYAKHGRASVRETHVTGSAAFSGDCEEYADAMAYQLRLIGEVPTVWYVYDARVQVYHAITCTESGWCFDANQVPMRREKAPYIFIDQMPRNI